MIRDVMFCIAKCIDDNNTFYNFSLINTKSYRVCKLLEKYKMERFRKRNKDCRHILGNTEGGKYMHHCLRMIGETFYYILPNGSPYVENGKILFCDKNSNILFYKNII